LKNSDNLLLLDDGYGMEYYAGGGTYWHQQRNVWSLSSQPCVKWIAPLPPPSPPLTRFAHLS